MARFILKLTPYANMTDMRVSDLEYLKSLSNIFAGCPCFVNTRFQQQIDLDQAQPKLNLPTQIFADRARFEFVGCPVKYFERITNHRLKTSPVTSSPVFMGHFHLQQIVDPREIHHLFCHPL